MIKESKIKNTKKTKSKKRLRTPSFIAKSIHTRRGNKIFGLVGLVGFALVFVLALIYATPIARILNNEYIPDFIAKTQSQNKAILFIGIGGLVIFCLYFMCRNSQRKTYYITNYVAGYLAGFYSLISSVICLVMVGEFQVGYEAMPFDDINLFFAFINAPLIPTTSFYFPIFNFFIVITLISSLFVILQTTLHLIYDRHITDDNLSYIDVIKRRIKVENKRKKPDQTNTTEVGLSTESIEGGNV